MEGEGGGGGGEGEEVHTVRISQSLFELSFGPERRRLLDKRG